MKDCHTYCRKACLCEENGVCYDSEEGCKYTTDKKECAYCKNKDGNILNCYGCDKREIKGRDWNERIKMYELQT